MTEPSRESARNLSVTALNPSSNLWRVIVPTGRGSVLSGSARSTHESRTRGCERSHDAIVTPRPTPTTVQMLPRTMARLRDVTLGQRRETGAGTSDTDDGRPLVRASANA